MIFRGGPILGLVPTNWRVLIAELARENGWSFLDIDSLTISDMLWWHESLILSAKENNG